MNRIIFSFFLFLLSTIAMAQKKDGTWLLSITDSKNNPLDVATVSINKKLYYPVGNNGSATIPTSAIKQGDTVFASCLGFVENHILVSNIEALPRKIALENATFRLEEVAVSNKVKNYTTKKVGEMSGFSISKYLPNPGQQLALYINNNLRQKGYIKSITFYLKNALDGIEQPFKIKLYNRKAGSLFPQDELSEELIVRNSRKKTFFEVDVSSYGIQLPEDGFFVVFEILPKQYYNENNAKFVSNRSLGVVHMQWPVPSLAMSSFSKKDNLNYSLERMPRNFPESLVWHRVDQNFLIEAEILVEKQ